MPGGELSGKTAIVTGGGRGIGRAMAFGLARAGANVAMTAARNRNELDRAAFSPYGPSKAAVESETIIWAQDLAGTGVTVNLLLPGGATDTGMVPSDISPEARRQLLEPNIMVAPLLWLVSEAASAVTGERIVAKLWDSSLAPDEAAKNARTTAGWVVPG